MRAFLFFAVFAVLGCGATIFEGNSPSSAANNNLINGKPYWYWNPSANGLGGVGEAGTHINGVSAQRELAVSRAIDEIARQKGVHVHSTQELEYLFTGDTENIRLNSYSVHTVEGFDFSVKIVEFWQDKNQNIYVWIKLIE